MSRPTSNLVDVTQLFLTTEHPLPCFRTARIRMIRNPSTANETYHIYTSNVIGFSEATWLDPFQTVLCCDNCESGRASFEEGHPLWSGSSCLAIHFVSMHLLLVLTLSQLLTSAVPIWGIVWRTCFSSRPTLTNALITNQFRRPFWQPGGNSFESVCVPCGSNTCMYWLA